MEVDEQLLEYATPRQAELIRAWAEHGSTRKAAKALGLNSTLFSQAYERVKAKAALKGYAPNFDMLKRVPEPFVVKGTSTLYGKDGEQKLQWVKTKLDDEQRFMMLQSFAESLGDNCRDKSPDIPAPETDLSSMLAVYPMGDPHFGMFSWAEETGEDFDVRIAERDLSTAVARLVDTAPPTDTAIVLNLGDFFHADNDRKMTSRSGNILDVDTRHAKVMRIGALTMVRAIELAAAKHRKVIVRNVIGNHDDHSSYALALILDAYFNNNPRVTIDCSPANFWYFQFGRVLIGSTHGHTCKLPDLPAIMANDRPEMWGDTKFRYWYTGHVHHESVKDLVGVRVETFRTLAPNDAWGAASGYRGQRDMHCIVLHEKYGEVDRHRVNIAMVRDLQKRN